jgi:hypothetical protein
VKEHVALSLASEPARAQSFSHALVLKKFQLHATFTKAVVVDPSTPIAVTSTCPFPFPTSSRRMHAWSATFGACRRRKARRSIGFISNPV